MAVLIQVKAGLAWHSSGGMFAFALRYLIPRLSDRLTADWLRTVVDYHLGSVWITDFPPATQEEIFELLRRGLVSAAERDLPPGPAKGPAIAHLQDLVRLTYRAPN